MRTYFQITAEIYTEHIVPVIDAKQLDTGRGALITLTDCGAVVVPEAGETLNLYCKKSDGTVSYLPGTLVGDAVQVDFTNTLLALPGIVQCELQVGSGADMVSTPVFKMRVLPTNYDEEAIISTDEFTALDTALATVQSYDQRIADNAADITALDGRVTAVENGLAAFLTDSHAATSTTTGNVSLSTNISTRVVLSAWIQGSSAMCIPFTDSSGNWYVKALNWNGSTYTPITSTSLTVEYIYKAVS